MGRHRISFICGFSYRSLSALWFAEWLGVSTGIFTSRVFGFRLEYQLGGLKVRPVMCCRLRGARGGSLLYPLVKRGFL